MVTIIKKPMGSTHPFYEYACLSTDVKPISLVPENSLCREIDTGKKFYFSDGAWHEAPGRGGGSGGGSGLPEPTRSGNILQVSDDTGKWEQVAFPLADEDNVGKLIGITSKDGVYKYSSVPAPSGGGAEKFIVTLTEENDTWTADKTIAEIVEAYEAKQVVVAQYVADGLTVELPINAGISMPGVAVAIFIGFENAGEENKNVTVVCANEGSGEDIQVTKNLIPTSTNAPLIVTLTAGSTEGQFVGDKTHQEVFEAFIAGRNVVFYAPSVGLAETVKAAEHVTDYAINTGSFTSAGAATDYITVNAG